MITAEEQRFNMLQHIKDQAHSRMIPIFSKGDESIDWLPRDSYYGVIEDHGATLSIYRKGSPMNWQLDSFALHEYNMSQHDFPIGAIHE